MSAIIKELEQKDGTTVYPVTVTKAVYMNDRKTTIDAEIQALRDGTSLTVFNEDGSITETLSDGKISTTVFNADGSIVETCRYPESKGGGIYYTNTTTFNSDGSIQVTMEWGSEVQA